MGLLETARRNGIDQGLLGGNRRWLVLGAVAWAVRAVGWAVRRDEQLLYRERLRPGQQLVVTERAYDGRRGRRRARRGAKRNR